MSSQSQPTSAPTLAGMPVDRVIAQAAFLGGLYWSAPLWRVTCCGPICSAAATRRSGAEGLQAAAPPPAPGPPAPETGRGPHGAARPDAWHPLRDE